MKFYTSIAGYYDSIFPLDDSQLKFIIPILDKFESPDVLDIGCATGSLLIKICENKNINCTGADLDEEMIKIAEDKAVKKQVNERVKFYKEDMTDLSAIIINKKYDVILCLGNTLAHLTDDKSVKGFLKDINMLLNDNGIAIIQIINYDKIINENIKSLPLIENNYIKFERYYDYKNEDKLINFKTVLAIKQTGEIIQNEVLLNPIKKDDLYKYLKDSNFKNMDFYYSYSESNNLKEGLMLVIKAFK